jgi:hypothetical protein
MATSSEQIRRIEQLGEEFARFVEREPADALHRRPRPDWLTAAELSGHIAEFAVDVAEQARALSQQPGLTVERMPDDPQRLLETARLSKADPAEAAAAVRQGIQQAVRILQTIPAQGWQVRGENNTLGQPTVSDVVQQFLLGHLQDHVAEAQAAAETPSEYLEAEQTSSTAPAP